MVHQEIYNLDGKKIWVTGHGGMVGRAILRRLAAGNACIIQSDRKQLDLRDQSAVRRFYEVYKPNAVIVAAAKVGGILANSVYPADFLYDNLMIETNLIHGAFEAGVTKLLFLGSSCIYPKFAPQPLTEDSLLTGPLEETNEWYAIAKIAGVKLCQAYRKQHSADFISAMPTNLYGPFDNFELNSSHVIPAIMHKVHAAKRNGDDTVALWGSGRPRREFMHVDDLADALVFLMQHYSGHQHINVGLGNDLTIADLAKKIAGVVGYTGSFVQDISKPDGTPRKLMDVSRLTQLGWMPKIGLEEGLQATYQWYLNHRS